MSAADQLVRYMERGGCRKIKLSGDGHNLISTCPFHSAKSGLQFAMSTRTGSYCCYSSRCGVGGTLARFLEEAVGYSTKEAECRAKDIYDCEVVREEDLVFEEDPTQNTLPALDAGRLGIYRFIPQYMLDRGFSVRTLKAWEIGYDFEEKSVVIPVRDTRKRLVGISRRPVVTPRSGVKYLHPFPKGQVLYGCWTRDVPKGVCWVGEGQLDVIALDQMLRRFGVKGVPVGSMGSRISKVQIRALAKFDSVVLAFDNPSIDDDGLRTTLLVGDILLEEMDAGRVWVASSFGKVKDPADLLKEPSKVQRRFVSELESFEEFRLRVNQ